MYSYFLNNNTFFFKNTSYFRESITIVRDHVDFITAVNNVYDLTSGVNLTFIVCLDVLILSYFINIVL